MGGGLPNNLIRLVSQQPFRNEADYRLWFARLKRYPEFMGGAARVMREGAAAGVTIPRIIVQNSLKQLESLAPEPAGIEASALWSPIKRFPEAVSAPAREQLAAEYRKLLENEVFPAIRRLAAFVRDEYLPRARTTDGFSALPRGAEMYRVAVRSETTTDMTPDAIHDLGLKEVARIQAQLMEAARRAGFNGPIGELRGWIRENPANFPFATADEVIAHLYRIHARIVPQLPRLFGRMPKAPFEIRPTEPELALTVPAQWHPPSDDGTRPGVFTIPIVSPRNTATFDLAALLAHEGMPGHHFDGGIRLENKVPDFRRRLWVNAFGEGWGLYAEYLGHDLGLYEEPLSLVGRYTFELFRACRLVVDTGLHAREWPRQRAIRYLVEECGAIGRRGDCRGTALHGLAGPGARLQDRRADHTRPARRRREAPGAALRRARVPRRLPRRGPPAAQHGARADGGVAGRAGAEIAVTCENLSTHHSSPITHHACNCLSKTSKCSTSRTPSPARSARPCSPISARR